MSANSFPFANLVGVSTPHYIVTHSGVFHADEVFAIAAIKMFYGEIPVLRTRDKEILDHAVNTKSSIVVDVGGMFDSEMLNFDHHQRGFNHTRPEGAMYSSFGLVWNYLIRTMVVKDTAMSRVFNIVDNNLVNGIDYVDTGFKPEGETQTSLTISSVVASLRPTDYDPKSWNMDAAFESAVDMAKLVLLRQYLTALEIVQSEEYVHKACSDTPVVVILDKYVPGWQKILSSYPDPLFCVFPDVSGQWRVQCVPPSPESFDKRLAFPASWGGKSKEELVSLTGISDMVFCHIGLFIAGTMSKESAIKLAKLVIDLEND